MFTVLIAEKEYIDAIQRDNKLFFEPFLESKDLAFCYWNPAGQSIYEAVPGLLDAVGRKKEWRAVVINNCKGEQLKQQNPFDTVDYSSVSSITMPERKPENGENWSEWESKWISYYETLETEKKKVYSNALEHPLQKLATWLCYRPESYILNDVQEKQDAGEWALNEINKGDLKPNVRLELLERENYKKEMRIKETLRKEFVDGRYLNIAYPAEIHCISVRTAENGFFDPDTYWNVRRDSDYSAFADRNMYFDKMRFMVFDLLPQSHRNFRTDYIRFLASVLIFISNQVPGSAMQARKLYSLETETDDTPLCTLVTSYDKKLASTWDVIESEMEKIRNEIPGELSDKAASELFCTDADVAVLMDESCDTEKVFADKDYGLYYDAPEDEHHKWNRDFRDSKDALTYIAKQQSRSVKKSVAQQNLASEVSNVNISRLTSFQIDDIKEYTDAAEDEMIASIPPDITDTSEYIKRMNEASEEVKKVINRRMTKKTTFVLGAICLGIYLVCFFPFLFSNTHTAKTIITAVVLISCMLGALAVIMLITLFCLRASLKRSVRDYNNTVHGIMGEIRGSMRRFSKFLSTACNVRRGHAVQNYAHKNIDEYTKNIRIRKKHQEDIRKKRACLAEDYGDYFADRSFCDETMARPYEYDFDQKTEYAYPAPFLAGDCRQIEFLSNGNYVTVPSSYVTRILVRMEGLYDE
ncbi:MAG: hypothetical protein IKU23_00125 [Clostridia bacterium]|nr:hypothetical protein [Clostridia bacterium]